MQAHIVSHCRANNTPGAIVLNVKFLSAAQEIGNSGPMSDCRHMVRVVDMHISFHSNSPVVTPDYRVSRLICSGNILNPKLDCSWGCTTVLAIQLPGRENFKENLPTIKIRLLKELHNNILRIERKRHSRWRTIEGELRGYTTCFQKTFIRIRLDILLCAKCARAPCSGLWTWRCRRLSVAAGCAVSIDFANNCSLKY
jgi:hypothetical protein